MDISICNSFHFAYVTRVHVKYICELRVLFVVIYLEIYISAQSNIIRENSHTYPFFTEIVYDIANS